MSTGMRVMWKRFAHRMCTRAFRSPADLLFCLLIGLSPGVDNRRAVWGLSGDGRWVRLGIEIRMLCGAVVHSVWMAESGL